MILNEGTKARNDFTQSGDQFSWTSTLNVPAGTLEEEDPGPAGPSGVYLIVVTAFLNSDIGAPGVSGATAGMCGGVAVRPPPTAGGRVPAITDQVADSFVRQLARGALDGVGPLAPAHEVAESAVGEHATAEAAIDAVVSEHTRLAAVNGFVTGLGGFVVLPVAVPANVLGFYTLAARMVGAIAHIRGHDVQQADTRLSVLAALTGDDVGRILAKAGVALPAAGVTSVWLRRMAPSTTTMVNKAIGFRLLVGAGERVLARLGRAIPVAGGVIGGTLDVAMIRSIARHARQVFPAARVPADGVARSTPASAPPWARTPTTEGNDPHDQTHHPAAPHRQR